MASDWRKCKLLNAGDKRAVKALYEAATFESEAFFFRKEPMRHMVGLVKALAARIVELELQPKQLSCKSVAKKKGGKRAK